ncbi:MAG: DUF342 domain-containing protein [Dehalococcoidia bacterium]|nr:DUF342 domain-containing protein [Dehalococcoidia bacterium]
MRRTQPVAIGEVKLESVRGWDLIVSPDKLAAYLIPALIPVVEPSPPAEGEPEASPAEPASTPLAEHEPAAPTADPAIPLAEREAIRKEMSVQQITSGILEDALAAFDPPAPVEDIVLIAREALALPGVDADIDITFDLDPHLKPITREDGTIDYHEAAVARFVEDHATLAIRRPPVEGTLGFDVHGQTLPPPPPRIAAWTQCLAPARNSTATPSSPRSPDARSSSRAALRCSPSTK